MTDDVWKPANEVDRLWVAIHSETAELFQRADAGPRAYGGQLEIICGLWKALREAEARGVEFTGT